ncbi:MAG: TRAP transporter substrate-binding protein DctP [Acidimicrobiia bacterium]|nr:TRAP transporter substrate-binding protein DctP [Acidimicrobiia bacterium]
MDRRSFLGSTAVAGIGLAACSGKDDDNDGAAGTGAAGTATATDGSAATTAPAAVEVSGNADLPEIEWEMPTSWPPNLDTIYGGAVVFAETVAALSGNRFRITPRAGGEVVPPLEVLQNVQTGAYPIGHTASYYYTGLAELTAFGTSLPFGLTARQQNAWLYEGGGLELLQGMYAERFNAIQFPAGNTGCQMGGWFNKEINSVGDLSGLKMRIPGLGGRIMDRLGVAVQQIAGGEIYQALQTGAIDAAEWVGPYDDLNLGFPEVAQFYYYPGWWEPGPTLEVQVSKSEWDQLPEIYQEIVQAAAFKANTIMMARYDKLNPESLTEIEAIDGITILPYPEDVLTAAREESLALYDELAAADADFSALLESWNAYRESSAKWFSLAEAAIINFAATEG